MSEQLVWQDRFNIGVDIIDKEHKKLFSIINRIFDALKESSDNEWICQESIKYFKNHAIKHFEEEEEYMLSINYSGYEMHKRIHNNFRKNILPSLERELEQTNFSEESINHFLGVCVGWLLGHTLTEDHAITGKSKSKWSGILPEDESDALSQVIIELLYEIFQLKGTLISEHYNGERFGKGIYYRLLYNSKQGKQEVILVFEERVILNTIASVTGVNYTTVNATTLNTIRYISQQFLESMREHFLEVDVCELVEENLLNYRQFQKVFQKENLRCSLLFDTGVGYFAFCAIAPSYDSIKIDNAINEENAIKEVKRYLANRAKKPKKKILVVDDSSTIRQFLKELLNKDYQIETADSGLSAFRSIILNKPDLVILDYDMPVCDGRQILEMIRAEKDMSDISVIFLTGRGDVESITKVMSLSPEGYILKTTKPDEIKKSIEIFFKKKKN